MINRFKNEFNIFLLVLGNDLTILDRLEIEKNHIFVLNSTLNTLSFKNMNFKDFFHIINEVKKVIKIHNIDLVYANLPISHFVMRIVKVFSITKFKLCNIHHSLQYIANPLNGIVHKTFNLINNLFSYISDDLNIFISHASKEDLLRYFYIKKKQSRIIYNGIDIPEVTQNNPFSEKYTNKFKIVIAGRMVPEKGHLFFLSTFKKLRQKNENIKVFFIGDRYKREEIEVYISKNNLDKYINILGRIERKNLLNFFSNTDIVVIPSVSEGFGNIAVEAILSGATVLSSDVGGLKEIIIDDLNGFLYNYKDSDALIKNIEELQKGSMKIDVNKAIEYTYERFSMNRMIEEYRDVTEGLLK